MSDQSYDLSQPHVHKAVDSITTDSTPEPLSAEQMEKLQSVASRLIAVQNEVLGMPQAQQEWFFGKEGHSDAFDLAWWINIELPKLRSQLAVKDLRIAELELASTWLEHSRNQLLDEHEAILAKLPEDSPCKHAETGHSVADDVADLVQEKARLEVDLGDEMNLRRQESKQLAASESARANAEQKAKQYLLRVGELAIERDAERAARKKAEEKGIAAMDDREHFREERDALRTGLEKILNHLSVLDGFHLLTHREDSMEVCYDWCPLCHLKDALAAARALLQPENPITQQAQTLAPAEREGTTKHNEDPALPKNQCKCCGAPCDEDGWCDVVIPNELWNRAFPDEGMVCFRCITRRLNEMGEKDVPLIWVAGPYADIEQERNSLLTKLESALLQPENPATDTPITKRPVDDRLRPLVERLMMDVAYLERSYPGIWTTGAGYVLHPRILELRVELERVEDGGKP